MIWRLLSTILLTILCGLNTVAAGDRQAPQRLGGATVTWNENRLTVVLKNAPVKGVLKGLMESENFACQVEGDFPGTITMTIDDLTVEEAVHKILRNRNYNYTMILSGTDPSDDAVLSELTIYQKNEEVRFEKVPKGMLAVEPGRVAPAAPPAAQAPPENQDRGTDLATEEMRKELDAEIKSLLEEMLAEEKMSPQEYEEALEAISDNH